MWSLTWQWNIQMPGSSGTMSATTAVAGKRLTVSTRCPPTVTVFPCQCGVCRSASVPSPTRYQRTLTDFHGRHRHASEKISVDRVLVVGFDEARILAVQRGRLFRKLGNVVVEVPRLVFIKNV